MIQWGPLGLLLAGKNILSGLREWVDLTGRGAAQLVSVGVI